MKIHILGGCFTVQYDIPEEKLYHRTLKSLMESRSTPVELDVQRYETFSICMNTIIDSHENKPLDILVFHLRTEPLMRISKLLYRFFDRNGRLRYSLNLPFIGMLNPEKYGLPEIPLSRRTSSSKGSNSRLHQLFREINNYSGAMIGNRRHAMRLIKELIISINNYCTANNIGFLLVGPPERNFSGFESNLSEIIEEIFSSLSASLGIEYLSLFGLRDNKGNDLMTKTGRHISQEGHDMIGSMIFERLNKKIKSSLLFIS